MLSSESKWVCIFQAALICLFTMSAWLGVNAIWVEIPFLLTKLPESWSLPSWILLIVQLANLGPFVYLLFRRYKPDLVSEWVMLRVMIVIAAVATILLIFFWDKSTNNSSIALILLTLFVSLTDHLTIYVFLPKSKASSITLKIGLGLGAVIPSLLGLLQAVRYYFTSDEIALFSVSTFFTIISVLLVLSFLSSVAVQYFFGFETPKLEKSQEIVEEESKDVSEDSETLGITDGQETRRYLAPTSYLLAGWMNFLTYGFIPAIQPFSCLSYSFVTFDLVIKLSTLLKPVGGYLSMIVKAKSLLYIWILGLIATVMAVYHVVLASFSSHQILQEGATGKVLAVLSALVMSLISAYIKTSLGRIIESTGSDLTKYRVFGQIGSFLGAVLGFVLVVSKVFKEQ